MLGYVQLLSVLMFTLFSTSMSFGILNKNNHKKAQYQQQFEYESEFQMAYSFQGSQCKYPLIMQSSSTYELPSQDLQNLLVTNLSKPLGLPSINVTKQSTILYNISLNFKYSNEQTNKTVQKISDTEIFVHGDSFRLEVTLKANVSKTVGVNTYTAITAKSVDVLVSYRKQFVNSKFLISQVTITYPTNESLFKDIQIVPQPKNTTNDKTKIFTAINNQLVTSTKQQASTLPEWLSSNADHQSFSATYPERVYKYQYYDRFNVNVDMSSNYITSRDINGSKLFVNGMQANVLNQKTMVCPENEKNLVEGGVIYGQYISWEFISNFIDYVFSSSQSQLSHKCIQNICDQFELEGGYQNINISYTWIKNSPGFQFNLVDLQFVSPKLVQKYSSNYNSPISFLCSPASVKNKNIDIKNQKIVVDVQWACSTYLSNNPSSSILDFQTQIAHTVFLILGNQGEYQQIQALVTNFTEQQGIDDIDENLAQAYLLQMLSDMRVYTVGTHFRVAKGTQHILYQETQSGTGIWVA